MRKPNDATGELLRRWGILDEDAVEDVLDQQRHTLPFASLCYSLGYADEETLVRALSRQHGLPGVVLDRSVIPIPVLANDIDFLYRFDLLPLREDDRRLFVAVSDPGRAEEPLRQLSFMRGRVVIPHICLHITLAKTLRACVRAVQKGEERLFGVDARDSVLAADGGYLHAVSDSEGTSEAADEPEDEARAAVMQSGVMEVDVSEWLALEDDSEPDTKDESNQSSAAARRTNPVMESAASARPTLEMDAVVLDAARPPPPEIPVSDDGDIVTVVDDCPTPRVMVADGDHANRTHLGQKIADAGYEVVLVQTGAEAMRSIRNVVPQAIVSDVMLPELDGYELCRRVKQSGRYQHIPVVLMSEVIETGRVTDDILEQHGADAYFEKPLRVERVVAKLKQLLRATSVSPIDGEQEDDGFERAIELYRTGDHGAAVSALREGISDDPLSAKHHFVLANLLQEQELYYEAIDEYEATVDLRPHYFPALTRLAYLYYRQGFAAKAIDTWRRSLPLCPDAALRENIEEFMRKLIADMYASEA